MKYTLFGHSFVRRIAAGAEEIRVEVGGQEHRIHCLGEGGLSFRRIDQRQPKYHSQIRNASPDILIIDLGTNDLTQESPEVVAGRLWGFLDSLHVKPSGIFILPTLPRTRSYVHAALSLVDFNRRVQRFNDIVLAESLRRDCVWVWDHRSLENPDYNLDGVHLTPRGTELYIRTLRRIISFCHNHFWV